MSSAEGREPGRMAALFDLDDTLIVYNGVSAESWLGACMVLQESTGVDGVELHREVLRRRSRLWADDCAAREARRDPMRARRQVAAESLRAVGGDRSEAGRLAELYTSLREEAVRLADGARELLLTLALAQDFGIALVTNGMSAAQRAKLRRFGLDEMFEVVCIEEETGYAKPSREAFLTALSSMHVTADQGFMIGDDYGRDIAGAKSAGLQTVWVRGATAMTGTDVGTEADRVVSVLPEVSDILGGYGSR